MSLYRLAATCAVRGRVGLEKIPVPTIATAVIRNAENYLEGQTVLPRPAFPSNQISVRCYAKKRVKKVPSSSSDSSSSSSDSDKEKGSKKTYLKRGQSSIWRKKMRTHHMVIDINKDGVVSWDDFEVLIKNFATLGNLSSKELEMFTDAMKHVWQEEWGAAGDPYAFIGQEQFLSTMEHALNTKELRKKLASPLRYFFKAVDWDSSGEISVEEYITFFKCLGLSEQSAIEAFEAIDINGDGRLSEEEFVRIGRDFFLKEDEADPSTLFWGPISE